MPAYSESRPRWHSERSQAKVHVRHSRHVVMHLPGRPRETVSITPASQRHHCGLNVCAAVVVFFLFFHSVPVPLVVSLSHALFQFSLKKTSHHQQTNFEDFSDQCTTSVRKFCSCSFPQTLVGTPSGATRCRMVCQLSVEENGTGICAEHGCDSVVS